LGLAAAENVHELVAAADRLEDITDEDLDGTDSRVGYQSRAIALSVLAAEEVAKAFVCSLTLEHAGEDPDDWKAFWDIFGGRRHQVKIDALLWLEAQVLKQGDSALAFDMAGESAAELFLLKNRATYVDIADGRVLSPRDVVDEESLARGRRIRKSATIWAVTLSLALDSPAT
jgi:AbiV family abortive infection protein